MNVDFVALDIETATFERSSICEIGLAIVESGKVVDSKSWLIQPEGNRYYDFNTAIHGITPEMTENSPTIDQVWGEVLSFINGKTVVAHNTAFDMYAIADAVTKYELEMPSFQYFCSLRVAKKVFPGLYSYSLPLLCSALDIEFDTHHRAESDAIGCAKIFLKSIDTSKASDFSDLAKIIGCRIGSFDGFSHKPQRQKSVKEYKGSILKNIVVDESKFDSDNYFYGKAVCFTGAFTYAVRRELLQAIADIGGTPMDSVTKATDVLVVGQQDYRVVGENGMSSKQKKAMALIDKGQDLEILSETEFLSYANISAKK